MIKGIYEVEYRGRSPLGGREWQSRITSVFAGKNGLQVYDETTFRLGPAGIATLWGRRRLLEATLTSTKFNNQVWMSQSSSVNVTETSSVRLQRVGIKKRRRLIIN